MDLLYHITIGAAILAVSPFVLLRMAFDSAFRSDLMDRLLSGLQASLPRNCIWIHAASVGEVRAAKILIASLKERTSRPIVLSTFTRTGFDLARAEGMAPVFRLPPDFLLWLKPLFDKIWPNALILIEAELWPGLLRLCNQRSVPVLLVNGRMSEKSFRRYNTLKPFFLWITAGIRLFSMRTAEDAGRVEKLGISSQTIHVTGNIKFDAVAGATPACAGNEKDSLLVVFGSTRPGDEEPVLDAVARLLKDVPGTRFVLAPRHLDRTQDILRMIRDRGLDFKLRSQIEENSDESKTTLILLDRMGELNRFYAQSCIAFVGGGFDPETGGQNILEPAVYGQPVIYGPHMNNFSEEARLLSADGGGVQIAGPYELYPALFKLLTHPEERRRRGGLAAETVKNNRGALARNIALIENVLNNAKTTTDQHG